MKRLAAALLAFGGLVLPVVSAFGHTESGLALSYHGQEVVVTGHDEFDPALHIELPSGVLERHCSECVLDKRQSAESRRTSGLPSPESICGFLVPAPSLLLSPGSWNSGPPRAPPLV
jgi:hypothetical protein